MHFTLVASNAQQRAYRSSAPITRVPHVLFNVREEVAAAKEKSAKFPWEVDFCEALPDDDSFRIVIISDAVTHAERLCFMGVLAVNTETGAIDCAPVSMLHISGVRTKMIYGGNPLCVFPDEYYLKEIAELNEVAE